MNIKQIIQNVSDTVRRKHGKKHQKEEEPESLDDLEGAEEELSPEQEAEMEVGTPEGEKDMLKGDHGKIFGVSRPVVIGVVVFFFVVFALAFIFASSKDSGGTPAKQKNQTSQIADNVHDGRNGELSDDYGALNRANEKKKKGVNGNTPSQEGNTVQARRTTAASVPASSTVSSSPQVSQVPRASVVVPSPASLPAPMPSNARSYSLPSEAEPAEEPKQAPQSKIATIEKDVKDTLHSAIAFFGGGDSGSNSSSGDASPASQSATASSSAGSSADDDGTSYTAYSDTTLTAGTLIPVILLTGINSDAPGGVAVQVVGDVYDASGTNLLIPAGSKILGQTSSISADSGRVGLTFNTLVMPDGGSWDIGDTLTAVDGMGYSGIQGTVHKHTGSNFMRGVFNSALSALSTINVDRVTLDGSALVGMKDMQNPTTTVDPGYQFQVYVTKNIAF